MTNTGAANVAATPPEHAWPEVVDRAVWAQARAELLVEEKAHTKVQDRLNSRRRRLPMTEVGIDYRFADPTGEYSFGELFAGREQLVVYHNMLTADDDWICRGCSQFADALGGLGYLNARGTTFVMESAARVAEIEAVKTRFGWTFPWVSSYGSTFREDFVTSAGYRNALTVFLKRGDRIYQTYITSGRGGEHATSPHSLSDLTPFGRGESWEDSPAGWPQAPTDWERLPDEL
jgi:predicted dithiol-disulfide oxidoreductase (DUF899 family)